MKNTIPALVRLTALTIAFLTVLNISQAQIIPAPFTIKKDLFDQASPDDLGLVAAEGTETITVFKPDSATDHYSNGVVMTGFKGYLYCQWQSSAQDEDAQDTWVAYSRSADGKNWAEPMVLAASIDTGYCSSGGWWATDDTLVAYVNVWPSGVLPRGGYTFYKISTDGLTWSEMKPLMMENGDTLKGIFEQDPHALPDGRIIGAAHLQPGLKASPIYTDDSTGISGWTKAVFPNLPKSGDVSRELEPSWYLRSDDTLVMTFRDQNNTYRRLAAVSGDRGETWSMPVLTNMPDSRSKQSAGNITDSVAFLVGNPVNNSTRIPLVIALSPDGKFFNTAYILRKGGADLQALRFEGQYKRAGYHYPKSMIWKDTIYVSYSTNKEDVEFTRIPLSNIIPDTSTADIPDTVTSESRYPSVENTSTTITVLANKILRVSVPDNTTNGITSIYNINGELMYQSKMNQNVLFYDMEQHPAGNYIIAVRSGTDSKTLLFNNW